VNAIILAAGMGTRLRPLTDEVPKALVKVGSESFFERQLRLLLAAGVRDVTVVTGYRADAFLPWSGASGVELIHNERYADWNNLYSMHLAKGRLGDTIVLDGDVWIGEGVLPTTSPPTSRWYVGYKDDASREWSVRCGADDRVERIDVAGGPGWILTGISYWTRNDGARLSGVLEAMMSQGDAPSLFWDDAPRSSLPVLDVRAQRIGPSDWAEVDTAEELLALRERLAASS